VPGEHLYKSDCRLHRKKKGVSEKGPKLERKKNSSDLGVNWDVVNSLG